LTIAVHCDSLGHQAIAVPIVLLLITVLRKRGTPRGTAPHVNAMIQTGGWEKPNGKWGFNVDIIPIGSMYGIYANIWGILMVNVTIYSIHGSYRI